MTKSLRQHPLLEVVLTGALVDLPRSGKVTDSQTHSEDTDMASTLAGAIILAWLRHWKTSWNKRINTLTSNLQEIGEVV